MMWVTQIWLRYPGSTGVVAWVFNFTDNFSHQEVEYLTSACACRLLVLTLAGTQVLQVGESVTPHLFVRGWTVLRPQG